MDLHVDFSQTEFGITFIDKGLRLTKINFLLSCLVRVYYKILQYLEYKRSSVPGIFNTTPVHFW